MKRGKNHSTCKNATFPTFTEEELAKELWRTCPIAPQYEASTLGRIRLYSNKKPMPIGIQNSGYAIVGGGSSKRPTFAVANLVFSAWCPDLDEVRRNSALEIDHADNCKTNNRVSNLRLVSHARNIARSRHSVAVRVGDLFFPTRTTAACFLDVTPATISNWIRKGFTPDGDEIEVSDMSCEMDGLSARK